ncbi:MAG: hypothetical protein K8R59_01040 [Thermoanaerobaculales bacterium]|nr:hypothetical protein [Thermoanaerobaculales bacterium]
MPQPHASPIALAEVLNKNPDVVSWWVGENIRRRLDDRGFAAELDRLLAGRTGEWPT